jgi:hypothetical protein
MIYPAGAIRTTEEMQGLIGKPVYLPLPDSVSLNTLRVGPKIIKFHPTGITIREDSHYWLETKEDVNAAKMKAISVHRDWSTAWGACPVFFFSNFWFAYTYVQHADNLEAP